MLFIPKPFYTFIKTIAPQEDASVAESDRPSSDQDKMGK
jgi:hypothetical protein